MALSSATTALDQYVGPYLSPKNGKLMVARDNSLLTFEVGKKQFILHPESETISFVSDPRPDVRVRQRGSGSL